MKHPDKKVLLEMFSTMTKIRNTSLYWRPPK